MAAPVTAYISSQTIAAVLADDGVELHRDGWDIVGVGRDAQEVERLDRPTRQSVLTEMFNGQIAMATFVRQDAQSKARWRRTGEPGRLP